MKAGVGMSRIERFCLYTAWLSYALPSIAIAIWAWRARAPRCAVAVLVIFALVACLFAAITRTWRRFYLVQYPLCVLGVAFVTYTLAFGMPPGHTLAGILVATSSDEVKGFIGFPQGRSFVMLLAAWSVCYLGSALVLSRRPIFVGGSLLASRIAVVLLLPLTAYAASNSSQLIDGIGLQPVVGSVMFLAGDIPVVKAAMHGSAVHKIPYQAHRSGGEEVHVLVVGESARRASWSAYGYGRRTTPYLDSLKNEAIFLTDVMADANLTSWAVPILLTGMTPTDYEISKVRGNIFDLAKEGGYSTSFLANQDVNIASIVGINADLIESPLDFSHDMMGRLSLDGQLLPAYRRVLAQSGKSRFIALHTMGSHWQYYNRYPKSFQRFGTQKALDTVTMISIFVPGSKDNQAAVVDAYDNTVLYTDWFLQQIIESARALTVPATVTFFPDHGEDLQLLDGESGHGQPKYTHAFEIPAFVWANDAYRKLHPDVIAALNGNSGKEIRTHNLFYTVADLMGIKWPQGAAANSFASKEFMPDSKMQYLAGGVLIDPPHDADGAAGAKKVAALTR
jgi:glucan phosphoethanolaminetransferase (alkaline phosphatase superfamily)